MSSNPEIEKPSEESPDKSKEQEIIVPDNNADVQKKAKRSNSGNDDIPMPPEIMRRMQGFMSMSTGSRSGMSILFEKFTPEHIDKYLDYVQRDDDKEAELKSSNRWFYMGYVVIALVAFSVAVIYLLPKDKDLLLQLIAMLVSFGGGFGLGKSSKDKDS